MRGESQRSVAHPPPKPLLLWDGDCHFCGRWVERWRETTAGKVDYATSQEADARYPEIPPEEFQKAVQFIEANGRISRGAEAVFRSLGHGPGRGGKWLWWCYERVPGFAAVTETAYAIVARNRSLASAGTRLLWGDDVRRPTYFTARRFFLRALGIIFLIAFLSLWMQVQGLIGSDGISPIADYLSAARSQLGDRAPSVLPTLLWFNASDTFLHLLCGAGAGFSLLLALGIIPAVSLLALFVCYLSLAVGGQNFLSFQWDILLLETGFLAIFFAPWSWRLNARHEPPLSTAGLFLLKLLLFKLMFMSGVVKLTSGDNSWWNLTALNYHFETQPLPTLFGWWAHQAPQWFQSFSTAFVLVVEVAVPFLIWAPRRLRLIGCAALVLLQLLIAITGNYAFFNLLTIGLCLLLIDDGAWTRRRKRGALEGRAPGAESSVLTQVQNWSAWVLLVVLLPLTACLLFSAIEPEGTWPKPLAALHGELEPFRIANGYGLFRVMTKTRPEIMIEGSADGIDWLPYQFKWKPGELKSAPRWVAPHQPRLDWQMWFAALGSPREEQWFAGLLEGLLRGKPAVVHLLGENPFPQKPPRYVRAILYSYHFSRNAHRRETGEWWEREEKREYVRPVSLPPP